MPKSINRRTSRSGETQYSDPVELHDTNRLRIEFVPFFIERTDANQLACKIVRYEKGRVGNRHPSASRNQHSGN